MARKVWSVRIAEVAGRRQQYTEVANHEYTVAAKAKVEYENRHEVACTLDVGYDGDWILVLPTGKVAAVINIQ